MFNQSHDFWFGLAVLLMYGFSVTDAVTTLIGLSNGLIEGNPIWAKVFGKKVAAFLLGTAGGVFISCLGTLALTFGFVELAKAVGHVSDSDSWLPFAIAAGFAVMTVRNTIKIYGKK